MEIGHLRNAEKAAEVGDLEGDSVTSEGVVHEQHVLVLSEQHRHVAMAHAVSGERSDLLGDPVGLGHRSREHRGHDAARWRAFDGRERNSRPVVDHRADRVRHLENGSSGAPVQRERMIGGPVRAEREVISEVLEVLLRRPAPFIDGLVGVADGHDRSRLPEEHPEQFTLAGIGVLILVEQHRLEPRRHP